MVVGHERGTRDQVGLRGMGGRHSYESRFSGAYFDYSGENLVGGAICDLGRDGGFLSLAFDSRRVKSALTITSNINTSTRRVVTG